MTAIVTRPLSDSTDSLLRFAMRLDATLTGLCGLAIAVAAEPIASLTGLTEAQNYVVGAVFVLVGAVVYNLAAVPNLRAVGVGVIISNIAFTVAAFAVAVADVLPLTGFGVAAAMATGLYTATFGAMQYLGVRRLA